MLCQEPEQLGAARTEIATLRKCRHDGILPLLSAEVVEERPVSGPTGRATKVAYLLFELWEEGTLYDRVAELAKDGRWLPPRVVLALLLQVAEALEWMAAQSPALAHYDIKPHNILVSGLSDAALSARAAAAAAARRAGAGMGDSERAGERGSRRARAVVMDLGSARECDVELSSRRDALELAEFAEAHVTASYRAPELFDPPSHGKVDAKVDVWALGAVLFAAMNGGRSPFEGEAGEVGGSLQLAAMSGKVRWKDKKETDPRAPNDWAAQQPPALRALCEAMLTVDAATRPTMSAVCDRMRAIIAAIDAGEDTVDTRAVAADVAGAAQVEVELPAMRPPHQEVPLSESAALAEPAEGDAALEAAP